MDIIEATFCLCFCFSFSYFAIDYNKKIVVIFLSHSFPTYSPEVITCSSFSKYDVYLHVIYLLNYYNKEKQNKVNARPCWLYLGS